MKWNNFFPNRPEKTGAYLVTLIIKSKIGSSEDIFLYMAWYDSSTKFWYRYDPFDYEEPQREKIRNRIICWATDLTEYIG